MSQKGTQAEGSERRSADFFQDRDEENGLEA